MYLICDSVKWLFDPQKGHTPQAENHCSVSFSLTPNLFFLASLCTFLSTFMCDPPHVVKGTCMSVDGGGICLSGGNVPVATPLRNTRAIFKRKMPGPTAKRKDQFQVVLICTQESQRNRHFNDVGKPYQKGILPL